MPSNPLGPLRSQRDQIAEGWFGPHTAVVDFCEENYQVVHWIAEFWNTLSNGGYVFLGLLGIYYARQEELPDRAIACQVALVVLGLGSAVFHATLMKTAMMMDDLPMIWLVSVLLYCAVQIDPTRTNWLLIASLVIVNFVVVACDLAEVDQVYHYSIFAGIAIAAAGRFLYLLYRHPHGLKPNVQARAIRMFALGTVLILVAFAIWNVDNLYCDDIQPYKERYGQPVATLLEGHVWWHLLTALGEYLTVTAGTAIVMAIQEGHQNFDFGNGIFGIPYVKRTAKKTDVKNKKYR